jgi:RNA polymerase sigma factor (sigma-70 family)
MQVELWLETHEAKLGQYARTLASRSPNNMHNADDLYQIMYMKIYMQARVSPTFIQQSNGYLFKTAWNEALCALHKQRKYELMIDQNHTDIDAFNDDEIGEIISNDPSPETLCEIIQNDELIQRAIASLPQKSQKVCNYLYAGYKPVEIAQEMRMRSRSAISYHIKNIQKAFERFGLQPLTA